MQYLSVLDSWLSRDGMKNQSSVGKKMATGTFNHSS